MPINESLIAELQQEAAATRKMLERVPDDKLTWKPHDKSMTLGQLASHVAELPNFTTTAMTTDELDFEKMDYKPAVIKSNADLLKILDDAVAKAVEALKNSDDDDFKKKWKFRGGEKVYVDLPKINIVRSFSYSHLYHHRGQLSVYLRLLDIALPPIYGPTADEGVM